MRVLITGATGLLGRACVLRLQRDGHEVLAWVRHVGRARDLLGADITLFSDQAESDGLEASLQQADAVVHLAGESVAQGRWTAARKQVLTSSRIDLTQRLVQTIGRHAARPRILLSASAVGIYGDTHQQHDENSSVGSGFLADLCREWEGAARGAERLGLRVALLRFGVVLARDGGLLERLVPASRWGLGGTFGSGRQNVPWVHLDDAVDVIAAALADDRYHGPMNVVAPQLVDQAQLAAAVRRAVGRSWGLGVPAVALKAILGEQSSIALADQQVIGAALARYGFVHRFPLLEQALRDLIENDRDHVAISPLGKVALPASAYLAQRRPSHELQQTTRVDAPIGDVFRFFSRAENAAAIAPRDLRFALLSPRLGDAHEGALVDYRIRFDGVTFECRTRFERFEPPEALVEVQEQGPYNVWWHGQRFERVGTGTVVYDRVLFAPRLGARPRLALARLGPGRDGETRLRAMFGYRAQMMRLRFGSSPAAA